MCDDGCSAGAYSGHQWLYNVCCRSTRMWNDDVHRNVMFDTYWPRYVSMTNIGELVVNRKARMHNKDKHWRVCRVSSLMHDNSVANWVMHTRIRIQKKSGQIITMFKHLYMHFTCVSAFVEIHQSLQCKIFQYTFLGQYPIKF